MIKDEEAARAWVRALPECDTLAYSKLEMFIELLAEENGRQNLVARNSLSQVWQRHIADSAQLLLHVPRGTDMRWLDLGTGAGFPGIVIAVLRPDLRLTMVESRTRRIEWLVTLCSRLELSRASVAGTRVQLLEAREHDVISARAFAPLSDLLTQAARLSTRDTVWLLPKGRSAAQELGELKNWRHMFHVEPSVTDADAGIVVGKLLGPKG